MQKSQSIHLFGLLGCESRNQRWWIGCFEFRDQRSVVLVIMSILRRDAAATMLASNLLAEKLAETDVASHDVGATLNVVVGEVH